MASPPAREPRQPNDMMPNAWTVHRSPRSAQVCGCAQRLWLLDGSDVARSGARTCSGALAARAR
eukprot:11534621-Alexandrium_andersonii.AAC.1